MIANLLLLKPRGPYPRVMGTFLPLFRHEFPSGFRNKSSVLQRLSAEKGDLLLRRLKAVDTAALCDADKGLLLAEEQKDKGHISGTVDYIGLSLMCSNMKLRNQIIGRHRSWPGSSVGRDEKSNTVGSAPKMVGIAYTVRCTQPDDLLAVLRGIEESKAGNILVVDTHGSTRAVAGGLFLSEARRRGLSGIVVDGPIRDMEQIADLGIDNVWAYSTSVTPYSGTIQHPGETDVKVMCGGIHVKPGDIVVGDSDGVVTGSRETFEALIGTAENIVQLESQILRGIREGHSLHSMTNYQQHLQLRKERDESSFQFKETRLVSFQGIHPT